MTGPCKDCPSRDIYCHATCEDYVKYKQELDVIRKNRLDYKMKTMPIDKRARKEQPSMRKFRVQLYRGETK